MCIKGNILRTVAPSALLLLTATPSFADLLNDDDFFVGTSGDGQIFSDPDEGVLEPGLKAVTFTRTRIPDPENEGEYIYVDPFEVIMPDLSDVEKRGEVTNCIMANKPDVYCDSEGGSGKRVKTQLTGRNPFDIYLRSTPSETYPSVDYFTFGKTSNFTGARVTGFTIELLDADGNLMGTLDPEEAVLFNLDATGAGIGGRLPDGLFGEGGQEGDIGFFSTSRAGLASVKSVDTLDFGALSNSEYVANFGTAFLDNTMTPDGLFWDDNDDPNDEAALVAWNNLAGGGWTYGNLDTPENIDARLAELADALGVEVDDLEYASGALVPEDIVAAAEANALFESGEIEDLRNANLNFTIRVGQVDGQEFTIRFTPEFADIVDQTSTSNQFRIASMLDAAANVPYLDLGYAEDYAAAIEDLLEMDAGDRANELESIGFSFLPAFSSLGFEFSRNQVQQITDLFPQSAGTGISVAQGATSGTWNAGDGLALLFALDGGWSSYDDTPDSIGYDVNYVSLSVGLEKMVSETASVGLVLGGTDGTADADRNRGEIDATGVSIAAFARARFGGSGLVQGVLGYQDLTYDSVRNVMGDQAKGSTDGSQVFAALQGEYMVNRGALNFGPIASIEYYDLSVDGFNESGAGAWDLAVGSQDGDIWLGSVGVRGDYELSSEMGNTRLTGDLSYTWANGDDIFVNSGFVGLPGASIPVEGMDDDWVDLRLGLVTSFSNSGSTVSTLTAGYSGSFGSDYESHRLGVAFNMEF